MSWRRASRRSSSPRRQSASTLGWAAGSASPRPGRARAPPAAPAPSSRPCTCSSARRRPRSTRCGAPSAPGRSCPRGRPASSARAWGRCATRRTLAPPRRRCRGASSRGAAWRRSPRTPPPRSAAAARPAAGRLVLEGALQHVLLAGQLEAHAPQAPSCAGAGASPPRSWSSCSACSGC